MPKEGCSINCHTCLEKCHQRLGNLIVYRLEICHYCSGALHLFVETRHRLDTAKTQVGLKKSRIVLDLSPPEESFTSIMFKEEVEMFHSTRFRPFPRCYETVSLTYYFSLTYHRHNAAFSLFITKLNEMIK